jgi:hypothetical protein
VTIGYSDQYKTPVVFPDGGETADDIIRLCRSSGAIFHEDGPDDECFVVALRPKSGPELWTEISLRKSYK